ncbi:LOW QUALITY PROTEIN: transcriptional regulator, LacI family [Geomicrobium sp. JCM 19038]|nr:LOW QUALITY PROTEIN: transcriptional regulator, LacI family [Geomicrobium sp. JCM 19038]
MKKVTMADVSRQAGVSKSTVSQYLNGRFNYMSSETKDRIQRSIEELGYSPNSVARSLRQKKTKTIGVIVANILHDFSTQVVRAIEDYCHACGFTVIICNADDQPDKERHYIDMLRAKQVDGLIVFPTNANSELFQGLVKENYPLVFIDRFIEGVRVNNVLFDNKKAMSLAVQTLRGKGYERIGLVTASLEGAITPRQERRDGLMAAMEEQGLSIHDEFIQSSNIDQIQEVLADMLQWTERPEAIIAGNDRVLQEVLKTMKQNDIDVPKEIGLLTIDDVTFAEFYNPAITAIAQPTYEMGRKAAELLLEEIDGTKGSKKQTYRFEPSLQLRHSC